MNNRSIIMKFNVRSITINGKEHYLPGGFESITINSSQTGLTKSWDIEYLTEDDFSPSEEFKDHAVNALTFDLNSLGKKFDIKGRWKNRSGWGHIQASHKSTGTYFIVHTEARPRRTFTAKFHLPLANLTQFQ